MFLININFDFEYQNQHFWFNKSYYYVHNAKLKFFLKLS